MTAALEGGEWSAARPGRTLPPGKDPVPILQEFVLAPGPVWTGGKSRPHRDSIQDCPARSSVAIPTELPSPHTHTHTHTHTYIYIYIYIEREREREKKWYQIFFAFDSPGLKKVLTFCIFIPEVYDFPN